MKEKNIYPWLVFALLTLIFSGAANFVAAQVPGAGAKTNSKLIYHGGRVLTGPVDLYFIWYGCWTINCGNSGSENTTNLMIDFGSNVGATPYFEIMTLFTDGDGHGPAGALYYGGSAFDQTYSHGLELSEEDIKQIVKQQVEGLHLPQDPNGIYVLIASADVDATATGFCTQVGASPLHGTTEIFFTDQRYGFLGNPSRCPSLEAPQFTGPNGSLVPTPNGDLAGDALASNLAGLLSDIVSDPFGDGWYDRPGLESGDKCFGTFGQTFTTANGARANVRLGQRNYLIQQNWVNDRHQRCAMQLGR